MPAMPFSILGIPGSLRRRSVNRALLVAARELAPEGVALDIFEDLRDIAPFSEDDEADPPALVAVFRRRIREADALLVATPEYNGSIPGQLKNALDWASRPRGDAVLDGKPAAVIGASPGRFGAARAQADVRKVLEASRARVLDAEFPVGRAGDKFDDDVRLVDDDVRRDLAAFVYGRAAHRPCAPWPVSLVELARDLREAA